MNYDKLTVPRFVERMESGLYKNITAARRAIGKADWSAKDRERARALANAHFGDVAPKQSPKNAAKRRAPGHAAKRRTAAVKPATHTEFVALAGKANESVEQIRLAATLMVNLRPALAESSALLLGCLEQTARRMGVEIERPLP